MNSFINIYTFRIRILYRIPKCLQPESLVYIFNFRKFPITFDRKNIFFSQKHKKNFKLSQKYLYTPNILPINYYVFIIYSNVKNKVKIKYRLVSRMLKLTNVRKVIITPLKCILKQNFVTVSWNKYLQFVINKLQERHMYLHILFCA